MRIAARRLKSARQMSRCPILLAVAAALAPTVARAQVTYTWNALTANTNTNTSWSPVGVPGANDIAQLITTPRVVPLGTLFAPVNQSFGSWTFGHYAQQTIDANAGVTLTVTTGQMNFTDGITESPGVRLTSINFRAPIAGSAGLTKTGPGFLGLNASNLYTGGTTIIGNGAGPRGGITALSDASLGAAGAGVTLQNGGALRSALLTSRPFTFGEGGGRIEAIDNVTLNGFLSGAGAMTLAGSNGIPITIGNAGNTHTGVVNIVGGGQAIVTGTLATSGSYRIAGRLTLGATGIAANNNRLNDAAPITLAGGQISTITGTTAGTENAGALTLSRGTSTIELTPNGNGVASINFASLTRTDRSTLFVRGRDLGNGTAQANRSLVTFTDASGLPMIGAGTSTTSTPIVPFAIGNGTSGTVTQTSVLETGLVTVGANGLRLLAPAEYASTITNTGVDNVRVEDSLQTQNVDATINALAIRDTELSTGNTGVTGNGKLTITSGAIVAVSDVAGKLLKIDNPVSFGSAEGAVHVAQTSGGLATLTLNGVVNGTNGLTKAGPGTLVLTNTASDYAGTTTVDAGGILFTGDIGTPASSSALGTGPIVINSGASSSLGVTPALVGIYAATHNATVSRPITILQDDDTGDLAALGATGGNVRYAGTITVGGGFLNISGALQNFVTTLSGQVTGPGGLQEPRTTPVNSQIVAVTNANDYAGGTIVRAGTWRVGNDAAFGTGTVWFEGGSGTIGTIEATGGPRMIANRFVFRAAGRFAGGNPITLSGPIDLGGVNRQFTLASALGVADVTMSGNVDRGGIVKYGPGRLILSGNNAFNSALVIDTGVVRATSNNALGASVGANVEHATFITNAGILELSGGITTPEQIFFGNTGTPILTPSSTGNLRSLSGDNVINNLVWIDGTGTLGVDAGSTLTINGTLSDNASGGAVLRKVGAGPVTVNNVRMSNMIISAGTVKVKPDDTTAGTSRVTALTISAGAVWDVGNNAFALDYFGTTQAPAIRGHLLAGRIIASSAPTGSTIGYGESGTLFASSTFPVSFNGVNVDATAIVALVTKSGDANLDRTVNFNDLLSLAASYGTASGAIWTQGDFNYDGAVNFSDLLLLAGNYGATYTGSFGGDWALAQTLVPEPATVATVAFGSVATLMRRRR
ncbi:MAG: autotransporter-associated beta strand repeat-containing protein [Tepidisphaeraceae bacterium]